MAKRRRKDNDNDFNEPMVPIAEASGRPTTSLGVNIISREYDRLLSGTLGSRSMVVNAPYNLDTPQASVDESVLPLQDILDAQAVDHSEALAYDFEPENLSDSAPAGQKKARGDHPLREWIKDRDSFLSEFLRLEGKGGMKSCADCKADCSGESFRCLDCNGMDILCKSCLVSTHGRNALHRPQVWDGDGGYFKSVSFKSLGYHFQLGHSTGQPCPLPSPCHGGSFVVLDLNGIHEISLDFCNCEHQQPHYIQLLRFGWFPATVGFPRSAATLRLLKLFQMLSFESKASVYEFHQVLSRLTDNTGAKKPPDRYRTLLRMVREYRNIKMLKRAGRGHDITGAEGTRRGECAVICPACPHPGINLPEGWEKAPANMKFLYTLFLAIDANFRLKRKMVSSHASDPSLSNGWSYFVEEDDFKGFLEQYGGLIIQEPSTCSNHNAVNKNNGEAGFAASGAACVDDGRHDMKRPCAVGDLQKGERYVNMDYLFCSTLQDSDQVEIVVSYDIACQWSINLWERLGKYPHWMHVNPKGQKTFRYLVPKFHLPAHIKACQTKFSFNYNTNVGRTEGEGVERGWSHINPVAASTREMGPGSRRDTLDDHFGDWNWVKTTKLGNFVLRQIKEAVPEMVEHSQHHTVFSESLAPDDLENWKRELSDWEEDHSKPNPYEARCKEMSQDAVRRQLAEKEEQELRSGRAFSMHDSTSASELLVIGLNLEHDKYILSQDIKALGTHATDNQRAKLKLRSNTLFRKIDSWIAIQQMYIPSLRVVRARDSSSSQEEPKTENITLHLPSSIPRQIPCDPRLRSIEWELRVSQCTDALDDLREGLRLKSHVIIFKSKNWRGQQMNTRGQAILSRNERNISVAIHTYRVARDALARLAPILSLVGWDTRFPRLKDEDIRALEANTAKTKKDMKNSKKVTEGHRKVSWIWTQQGMSLEMTEDERLHESLRIEWCKGKARQDRWKEEVLLLLEERRRILAYFKWKAGNWDSKANDPGDWMLPGVTKDTPSIEGRQAYARQQAAQFREMRLHCLTLWKDIDGFVESNGQGDYWTLEVNTDDNDDNYVTTLPED